MSNKAHVILRGTIVKDPTTAQTSTNQTWLKIALAVQTTKKDPAPKNPKYPYLSDFYNVNVYGKYAESLVGKVKMGSKLVVIGDMYMGEPYTSRDGKTSVTPVVTASEIEIVGGGNYKSNNNNNNYNNNYNNNSAPADYDEAPF